MIFGYYWASAVLALIVAVFALDIMGLFNRKNYLEVDGKVWRRLSQICEIRES
jgi:hypothetical protein